MKPIAERLWAKTNKWKGLMYGCLLLGLQLVPLRIFVNRATAWMGKNSYSIYLIHPLVIGHLMPFYRQVYMLDLPDTWLLAICVSATLVITLALSEIAYILVERPGEVLGRAFIRRHLTSTRAALSPAQ